jgi:hypothetical protein
MDKAWKERCKTGKRTSCLCRKCAKKFIEEAKPIYGSCKFLKTWKPKPLPDYMTSDTKWFLPDEPKIKIHTTMPKKDCKKLMKIYKAYLKKEKAYEKRKLKKFFDPKYTFKFTATLLNGKDAI